MTSVEYMHFVVNSHWRSQSYMLNTGFTVRALVVTDFSLFLSLSIFFLTKIKKNCDSHIH